MRLLLHQEFKRKAFHLVALIYVLGAVYLRRETYIAVLGVALSLVGIWEILRLRVPLVNRWFLSRFGGLFREKEHRSFSGIFWLIAGVLITVLLLTTVPLISTALLYVILGDTAASLVGIRVGGLKWPGTNKTIVGSVACFATCVWVGWVLLFPAYGWMVVLTGAAVATFLESGLVPINDNLLIPAGSALALRLVS